MPGDSQLAAMREYYERAEEQDRLDGPQGQLEFARTKEIVLRHLPPPPAVVADVGGGPGRYSLWLASLGYRVVHRDLMPLHVGQLRQAAGGDPRIQSAVADARRLDLADGSADAVLLLGPLYHLDQRRDRVQALTEAHRVVRPGGPVIAAAISRWAVRMDGILKTQMYQTLPQAEAELDSIERTGLLPPLYQGSFCGYTHRPGQLRAELAASGLVSIDVVSVEGPAFLLGDLAERLADDESRRVVLETARALEQVPELLGIGTHLIATGRRAAEDQRVVAMPPSTGMTAPVT
jgi:SAM-dependent methyltransferase